MVVGCGLWAGDRRRRCGRGLGSASSAWWCVAGKSGLSLLSLSDSLSSLFSVSFTPILSLRLGFGFGLIWRGILSDSLKGDDMAASYWLA